MPNCKHFEGLCSASLDGELTRAQKRELEAHLAQCPACAAYLEDLKLMRTAWGDLKEPLPAELHEKIMENVLAEAKQTVAEEHKRKRRPPVFTMLAAAAACVMLALSGTFSDLFGNDHTDSTGAAAGGAAMAAASADAEPAMEAPQQAVLDVTPSTLAPSSDAQAQPEPEPPVSGDTGAADTQKTSGNTPSSASKNTESKTTNSAASAQAAPSKAATAEPEVETGIAAYSVDGAENGRSINKAEKQSVTLPDDLQTHQFGLCYVAVGSGDIPTLKGSNLLEKRDNVYYFEVRSSLSTIESDIKKLQENGFETATRQDIGINTNDNAESILLIIVTE